MLCGSLTPTIPKIIALAFSRTCSCITEKPNNFCSLAINLIALFIFSNTHTHKRGLEKSMISSDINMASAVGGKSVRACDSCVRKRARWYCAADDAFLCQSCDSSVHSANPLARRHERVRLKTSSIKSFDSDLQLSVPTWHMGFTRKARTPRQKKNPNHKVSSHDDHSNPFSRSLGHLVPEICSEENSNEENEEQLLYRVPVFDPFVAELCTSVNSKEENSDIRNDDSHKAATNICDGLSEEMNHLQGFLPSEMDLAEFAADVESLLGKGLEDESFDMEGLGLLDCDDEREKLEWCSNLGSERVKVEDDGDDDEGGGGEFIDIGRETFELNFEYDSPITGEDEEDEDHSKATNVEPIVNTNNFDDPDHNNKVCDSSKKIFLQLNYDRVLSAWDNQKSPWTTGERPDLDSSECWPECSGGTCGTVHVYGNHEMGVMVSSNHAAAVVGDGGREARVSRYREKRRTRLFSKKIRYEVRKLNAEKRPRMKGRFVKRANFVAQAFGFAQ